jgi:hypothetical protein
LLVAAALAVALFPATAGAATGRPHQCPKLLGPHATGKHPRAYWESDIRRDVKRAKCQADDLVEYGEWGGALAASGEAADCRLDESTGKFSDLDEAADLQDRLVTILEDGNKSMQDTHDVLFELGSYFLIMKWRLDGLRDATLLSDVIDKSESFVKALKEHVSHLRSHNCSALSEDQKTLEAAYKEASAKYKEFVAKATLPPEPKKGR